MERETVIQKGKYFFTDSEKQGIASTLASKQIDKCLVEDEKKSVMSDFKDRIDRLQLDINIMSRHIVDGYEMRDFECTVEKDFIGHVKRFVDVRTHRVIDERPLDPSDYQDELPLTQAQPSLN